ncbi:MAG: aspartyl protease family protein [Pirellulales bacterium]|nr:aspartyl protease family protein [Pirellulales bacterium]
METETMGRILIEATIENHQDVWDARRGMIPEDQVRRVTIKNALVDTGATMVSLPTRLIEQLGLEKIATKSVTSSAGVVHANLYNAVKLTIQGRECTSDVLEVPDNVPPLIGQIPLELLDFVIDPRGQRLIGNPEHGGEHMFEMY